MRKVALDSGLFLASAAAAVWFQWTAKELIWGMWLSSLLVGYAVIVVGIAAAAAWRPHELLEPPGKNDREAKPGTSTKSPLFIAPGLRIPLGLGILAFFTIHFGMFHLVHGLFLTAMFPLGDNAQWNFGFGVLWKNADQIIAIGWPLALTSLIGAIDSFRSALDRFEFMTPYKNVVRMHLFIIAYGFMQALHLDSAVLYVVVLAFYWFPYDELRKWRARARVGGKIVTMES